MGAADIDVRRLRLVAGREASAQTLRARVEDALRISSKPPGLAHRFLCVRKLRLSLPREASAQSLALRLEQQWRRLEALAQPIATASADADAVWAVDEVAARVALLHRWLDGAAADAWFWRRLLPAAVFTAPLTPRVVGLLFEPLAAASPALEQALPQRLWREAWPRIVAAGQQRAVLAALNPQQLAQLQQALRPAGRVPEALLQRAGAMAAVAEGASLPVPFARVDLPPVAAVLPRRKPSHDLPLLPQATAPEPQPNLATGVLPVPLAGPTPAQAAATAEPGSEPAETVADLTALAPTRIDGEPTDWAGLWFLLPLLQQLGLAQQPEPARLLASLLQRAATRHALDAPALAWLQQFADLDDPRADDWWRRARRACVRQARLPLRRLLHRPGRVWLSPHRIDLGLPLASADIRIRRAGFDIDPGYLPWLDCVIHFHYS
jgi:hypothetical protein